MIYHEGKELLSAVDITFRNRSQTRPQTEITPQPERSKNNVTRMKGVSTTVCVAFVFNMYPSLPSVKNNNTVKISSRLRWILLESGAGFWKNRKSRT